MVTKATTATAKEAAADKNGDGKLTLTERVEALEAEVKTMRRAMNKADDRLTETREVIAPRLAARGIEP